MSGAEVDDSSLRGEDVADGSLGAAELSGEDCNEGDIRQWRDSAWICRDVPAPAPPNVAIAGGFADVRLNAANAGAGLWYDVPGRSVQLTKRSAASRLRVTYDSCRWRILVNGNQVAYFSAGDTVEDTVRWRMDNGSHMAWVSDVAAGSHQVKVQWSGATGAWSSSGTAECLAGWNTTGNFLSVEEI